MTGGSRVPGPVAAADALVSVRPITLPCPAQWRDPQVWVMVDPSAPDGPADIGVTVAPVREPVAAVAGAWVVLGRSEPGCRYGRIGPGGQTVLAAVPRGSWSAMLLAPDRVGDDPDTADPEVPDGPGPDPVTLLHGEDPLAVCDGLDGVRAGWATGPWSEDEDGQLAERVAALIGHPEPIVRLAAVEALGELVDPLASTAAHDAAVATAVTALRTALDDELAPVARAAAGPLRRTGLIEAPPREPDEPARTVPLGPRAADAVQPAVHRLPPRPVQAAAGVAFPVPTGDLGAVTPFESPSLDLARGAEMSLGGATVLVHLHPAEREAGTVVVASVPPRPGMRVSLLGDGPVTEIHPGELDVQGQLVLRGTEPGASYRLRVRGSADRAARTVGEQWPSTAVVARGPAVDDRDGADLQTVVDSAGRRMTVRRDGTDRGLEVRLEGIGVRDRHTLLRLPIETVDGERLLAPLVWLPLLRRCVAVLAIRADDRILEDTTAEVVDADRSVSTVGVAVGISVARAIDATADRWREIAGADTDLGRAARAAIRELGR